MTPTKLDKNGEDFIIGFEGEVLHLYNDPAGFATFGVGHLVARKPWQELPTATKLKYGTPTRPLPKALARKLSRYYFRKDIRQHEEAVVRFVPERWRTNPGRFTTFVSMSFNLGPGVLTPQPPLTSLGIALNGSQRGEAGRKRIVKAILLYDKAGSPPRPLPGLTRRRKAEAALFDKSRKP